MMNYCRRGNARWLLSPLKSNCIHSFWFFLLKCVLRGFCFVSIKLTKKIAAFLCDVMCGIFLLVLLWFNWVDTRTKNENFFYIDQSITVIEFRVYVISSPYSTSVYFFLFRLNVTHCLNYFVGLHCCYCFGVTIFRPSFKQFIEQICCVCFKCCLSGFWSPYRWLQNRISNSTTTLKTTFFLWRIFVIHSFCKFVCTHTHSLWVLTNN